MDHGFDALSLLIDSTDAMDSSFNSPSASRKQNSFVKFSDPLYVAVMPNLSAQSWLYSRFFALKVVIDRGGWND
jgi:hypothetical protein